MQDPRERNKIFNKTSVATYLTDYAQALCAALGQISQASLESAKDLLVQTGQAHRTVFVAGNGGSAAIADHLCCDCTKGTFHKGRFSLKTVSLVANTPLLTAIANDFGYSKSFSTQLEMLATAGDLLILISSSGNSDNIKEALLQAKNMSIKVIGLTGFSGGALKDGADVSLHIPFDNYGIVEDGHQALVHVLAQFINSKI
jgi:D-sedoheptulose 7-phosphate isomerase